MMAYIDGFADTSNLLAVIAKQPLSPFTTDSESSSDESGISSLDSDDLKKQSLTSPTISLAGDYGTLKNTEDEKSGIRHEQEKHETETSIIVISAPIKVVYQHRDILDLTYLRESKSIVQYTLLPENNVNSFFQNRAQYWRLSTNETQECAIEKCRSCEFSYPLCNQFNHNQTYANNKNSITNSLLAFLKSTEDMQTPQIVSNCRNSNVQFGCQNQRQQYQTPVVNGFCGNNNSYNYNQQINSITNSRTTLPLNNASQNATFQTMSNVNNTLRYNNVNNNYGLYKQF